MVSSTALLTRMPDSETESLFSAAENVYKKKGQEKCSEFELHVEGNNLYLFLEMT